MLVVPCNTDKGNVGQWQTESMLEHGVAQTGQNAITLTAICSPTAGTPVWISHCLACGVLDPAWLFWTQQHAPHISSSGFPNRRFSNTNVSLLQIEKKFDNGTHVGFEDQVVLGDAEVVSDILPWLNPLLLWLIIALSAFGVPFLPLLLGRVYKARLAADSALRLKAGMKPGDDAPEMPVFSRLLINPQDIALLSQQAGKKVPKSARQELKVSC